MTAFVVFLSGWILCNVILLICLHGIYVLRENAIRTRRKEAEEETVEEFRREMDDLGVALFEIPDNEAAEEDLHE